MFYCMSYSVIFMIPSPLTRFKNVVSFVKTMVCATLGLIIESWPALTTWVTFGELGLITSWNTSIICPFVKRHFALVVDDSDLL